MTVKLICLECHIIEKYKAQVAGRLDAGTIEMILIVSKFEREHASHHESIKITIDNMSSVWDKIE
jgi:hypothetical protein